MGVLRQHPHRPGRPRGHPDADAGGRAATGSLDLAGALTVTTGLAATVYAIVRAPEVGWGSAQTLLVLAGAGALLALFLTIQARRHEPLVRLGIFRAPNLAAANVAQLLLGAAWIPMWFFLNLYLQQVLGYTAFPSGAALLPMTVLIMIGMIVLAPRAIARFGPKAMTVTGLAVLAVGMAGLSLIRAGGNFWVDVLPASLVAALGMSLAFIPSLGTAISSARPEEGGLASGIVNTSYQLGSALGLAAMTALAAPRGADQPPRAARARSRSHRAAPRASTGCAIGEVRGVVIGTALGWSDLATIALAVALAFVFGYALTVGPVLRAGVALSAAIPIAWRRTPSRSPSWRSWTTR